MNSISNNDIKRIRQLHSKKGRAEQQLFIIEGEKLVQECLSSSFEVSEIFISTFNNEHFKDAIRISNEAMGRISLMKSPPGVLAIVKMPSSMEFSAYNRPKLKLAFLEDISDPGNLGTIIRTADWFGFDAILCGPKTVELYNPKVIQSTMGSIFRIPVYYCDLELINDQFKQNKVSTIGADMEGTPIHEINFTSKFCIIIGNESHGLSEWSKSNIDQKAHIEGNTKAESLNAAIAFSIFGYQSFIASN